MKNVLIRVDKFIWPIDFVILNIEEDAKTPIILGRPFLTTRDIKIRVKKKTITFYVNGEQVTFGKNGVHSKICGDVRHL